jgi:hypothetical protein
LRAISRIWTILLGVVVLLLLSGLAVRFVLPHAPWLARPTVSITPAGGATEVVPRSRIVLQFSRPMNRHSVEQALQIDPPTAGTLTWSDDGQTLRFLPDPALTSGITYTVSLEAGARSRWWRPLAEPVRVAFRTVRSPTVIAALPNAANIPTDTPVALVFSRPMVPPARLNTPVELPQLRIEPPLPGTARWIDVDTLLLRPAAPLQPDTRYQATIAGLSDVRGVELEEPVTWRWHTRAPTLLSYAPAAEDRWVAPRQPLQLTLAQPLDPATLRERLVLTPTMPVDLATATLPTGNQVITFTPTVDWQPDRTYSALFRLRQPDPPEESPVAAGGLDTATVTWSFTTAPEPEQTGSFPGQGQLLPRGQSVRLIFSTPMDATALSAGLTLDPPVDDLRVNVDDTMVRLLADWQPATSYTLSIPADVVDRNGVPLQNEYRLDFRTAPAAADLSLPEVNAHILSVPATDQPVALTVERTNLAALELELYSLDAATLLRTLTFSPADWRAFRPERYNQSLLRAWRVPLDDPPDQTIRSPLSLAATEAAAPLPPGAYYLHLSAPEGPQENLVLLVSNIELLFKQSATEVLVWAVDRGAGTPLADLPLTLYRGDAVVARGQSNSSGLWQVTHNRRADDPPYLVLAGDPALAVVSSAWQLPTALPGAALTDAARYRSVLTTSRQAYTAGETVQVGGFVRQVLPDGTLALPRTGTPLELLVQPVNSSTIVTRTTVALPVSGVVSAGLQLDQLLAPGEYTVRATVDDAVVRLPFWVRADAVSFDITFDAAGAVLPLRVTSAAVPVASAELTWNLRAVPVDPRPPPALPSGFHFGDPEQSLAPAIMQAGHGQTDAAGQFAIPLVDPATLTRTLRYAVSVEVAGPGGARSQAATLVTLEPTGTRVGLRLPNRIVTPGEPAVVEALALDASGTPVADARITVELYQRTWTESPASTGFLEPQDQLLLTRSVNADDQGRLQLELPVTANGEYRVVARADALSSAAPFWATTPGYTGWAATDTQVEVIPNRESYRPGDTARLLVTSPFEIAATLVTLEQNGTVSPQVQPLRAGELLDIPITPEMAPNTYVGLVLVEQGTGGTPAGVRYGYARLNVVAELPTVTTTITTNQETYMPGETATVTLTTRNADGEGVSANLLLAVTGDDRHGNDLPPPDLALPQQVYPPLPAGMLTAAGIVVREGYSGYGPVIPRNPEPDAALRFDPQLARVAYWNPRLRTAYDGALVVRVPLPRETANWRITAYTARGANFFGQASTVVAAVAPLELAPETPPLLRAGDRTEVAVVVRNTTSLTRELRVTLNAGGAMLEDSASAAQIGALPPGGAARFAWSLRANTATSAPAQARLRFSAATADGVRAGTSLILPIAPAGATRTTAETLEVTGAVSQYIPAATRETPNATEAMLPIACRESAGYCPWAALELVIAPTTRAAIVTSARDLLDLPERSLEQEASLLLLSATLVRTAEDAAAAAPWHAQIRRSRTILAAAQTEASGWGAWPDAAPTPFLTGYVLEAQAVAAAALDEPFQPDPDALRWLRQADTPASDPDLRAYIQYVLAQVGAGDPEAARALLDLDLGADGLAYLALTLPSDEAESPLARLRTLVRRTSAVNPAGSVQLFWEAENAALPARSSVSTTAVAVLALQRLQPDSPQIPPALRTLRLAWGVDGWPTAFAGARAGLALLAAEADLDAAPSDEGDARAYELVLNADTLVSSNQSRSAIHSLLLTGEQLRARNLLRIVPQDADSAAAAPLLVAYRLREQIPAPITRTQELAIHQDLLDPDSATPLDPEALQVGQLVRVRLTLLALQPLDGVTLDAPLPAPFAPVVSDWRVGSGVGNAASDQPWSLAVSDWSDARLQFVGTDLAPGIYTQDYLARVVAPGSFTVPPPRAAPTANPDDAALGRERHLRVNQ